jgi:hypothetical protein
MTAMLSRRHFFVSAGAMAAGAAVTPFDHSSLPLAEEDFAALWRSLRHPGSFAALGEACFTKIPWLREIEPRRLAWNLAERLGGTLDPSSGKIKQLLRDRISEDYERWDVVAVDGWRLATTEVLLSVLAARTFAARTHDGL